MTATPLDCSDLDRHMGVPIQPARLKEPLSTTDIRRWVQGMHYPNRMHCDEEFAAEGRFAGLVAPLSFAVATDDAHGTGATVIAITSRTEKAARLQALGADHVINYKEVEEWGDAVLALTDGIGVDHVIEVGGPNTMAQSLKAARTGAHIAMIGAVTGFAIVQAKRLHLQGVTVGSRRDQIDMVRAIETNGIKRVMDRSFPLQELADAFRYLNGGGHFGKVCIDV